MPETNQQGSPKVTETQWEKVRKGAPNGPRKNRRKNYDGREPLEYYGHEAVARFLAFPKSMRDFKTMTALAESFNVSRMTAYRWRRDIDVLKRANWLSAHDLIFDMIGICDWAAIMQKTVEMAKAGNMPAVKFCFERAFTKM